MLSNIKDVVKKNKREYRERKKNIDGQKVETVKIYTCNLS